MRALHDALVPEVDRWREEHYASEAYPAIGELLEWAADPDSGTPRFLRVPQLRALETYWYLRLERGSPHVFDLYRQVFEDPGDLLDALGLTSPAVQKLVVGQPLDALWARIRDDADFVREQRLESVRETLTLEYPSYILALAMGAGKTALIGTIFASEFAMALEYPDGPFVQNALVFAPGKTILGSLRELFSVPYDRILPPRLYKPFAASVKITFTRDGEKDIPVVRRSSFNVVVTNTEKIRIQKETIRRADLGALLVGKREDDARAEVANLRLQAIASLPNLAVFSDEAHHTYGQSLETELKKVRKTVDYLARETKVVVVVNTTGTPYFRKQPLRDVVIWYGLSQGIRDGILKDVAENVRALELDDDPAAFVGFVIEDFFKEYRDVRLPDGAPAKLALYFPQNDDLDATRPAIDAALARAGLSPSTAVRNTSLSSKEEIDAFDRLNDPASPHRIVLLVNKGTEGWNCPSLFGCALARKLKSSNNFVLQAATRCLRQVPGNKHRARIYLSHDNVATLDRQLQETYNETLVSLAGAARERRSARLVLRKRAVLPLSLRRTVRTVQPSPGERPPLRLARPESAAAESLRVSRLDVQSRPGIRRLLQQIGETAEIETVADVFDLYDGAVQLAANSRQAPWQIYDELKRLYPEGEVPASHVEQLAAQVAEQSAAYVIAEETVEWALALVKPEGFTTETAADGQVCYVTEILYPKDREHLLLGAARAARENPRQLGFHYDPYNFDSGPELDFFQQVLREINVHPAEVEDVYFTGGLTDPAKTELFVEYLGEDERWHRYTPDFVIRKRASAGAPAGSGRVLIVEVKNAQFEAATQEDLRRFEKGEAPVTTEGRKAVALRKLEGINPGKLRYEIVFAKTAIAYDQLAPMRRFVREPEAIYGPDLEAAEALREPILALGPDVWRIYLFGSRARGDATAGSDFDLLVVVEEIDPSDKQAYLASLYEALRGAAVAAEPWVMSRAEFEESKTVVGGLAYPAWTEGVVLYENP